MPSSPIVEVRDGAGSWIPTTNGADVTPGNVISIRLQNSSGISSWGLEIFGVDEVTANAPVLSGVNPTTHLVVPPSTVVTFTMPAGAGIGRAVVFRSAVDGGGGSLTKTFGVFTLTSTGKRVGAVGERFEGDPDFGWLTKLNPLIRNGGGGGGSGDATSIQGTPVEAGGASIPGQVPVFDGSQYAVRQLTQDDILPSFAISGFGDNIGSYVELGSTVTNPAFTASYTAAPNVTAGSVTIHDNAGNPTEDKTLAPTAFSYLYGYTKTTYGQSVSFTLSATKGVITRTAGLSTTWVQKAYHGIGAAGQSSEAFIKSLTGALATGRATTFSATAGASDKIYYAYRTPYGAATFFVGGFEGGFGLVSTTIAVTNTYGVVENYTLYESTNLNLGATTVQVT